MSAASLVNRDAVQREASAEYGGVEVVTGGPHLVRHHEHRRRSRLHVIRRQAAADERRHAKKLEVVGRDVGTDQQLGSLGCGLQNVSVGPADDILEDVALFLVLEELGNTEEVATPWTAAGRVTNLEGDHPVGIDVGEGIEQDVLDDTEDCGRGSDAQGQCQDGEGSEGRLPDDAAPSITDVLPDGMHGGLDV